ncbi:hypothetical protein TSUD_161310 [Trifolium subterraneum]|uniref:PHD finger protein ALFIN-LIKE n=2 Tax=Trifolium TaxID=3898 RepID=A0A2Z6MUL2_TRISU|nr:hypothetical protein TSUD_161310 [Trifolium subterraneum]
MASSPRTVEEIFKDYDARRTAVVRALTHDVDEFYGLCDPGKVKRLFSLINDLPTVFELVSDRKPVKDNKPAADSGSKSRGSTKRSNDGQVKSNPKFAADDGYEEEEDEHSETLCGSCGGNYNADEFWIGCDICERWYHGKCVKITPAKAESIKQYKCPQCSIRRNRP